MPEPIEELYVVIGSDISKLLKETKEGVDRVEKQLKGMGDTAEKETKKASKGFERFSGVIEGIAAAAATAVTVVVGFLTKIGASAVKANSEFEVFATQFETLLGSAGAAQKRLQELTKFGIETPFELNEIVEASRVLQVFGGDILATGDNLRMIGDIAAGVNQPFKDVATWVGRMYDAMQSGRPFGEASARLQEMGALSGKARAELEKLQKEGASGEELWVRFNELVGAKFAGNMERLSGTLQGITSNLIDFNDNLLRVGGADLFEQVKDDAQDFLDTISEDEATDALEGMAMALGNIIAALEKITAGDFIDSFKDIDTESLNQLTESLNGAALAIEDIGGLEANLNGIIDELSILLDTFTIVLNIINKLSEALPNISSGLRDFLVPMGPLVGLADDLSKTGLADWFRETAESTETASQKTKKAMDAYREGYKALYEHQNALEAAKNATDDFNDSLDETAMVSDAAAKAIDSYGSQLLDLQEDTAQKSIELEEDHAQALTDIQDEYTDALADAESKRSEALADAEKTRSESLADLEKDIAKQRADIIEGTRKDLADLEKETNRTLKEEQDTFNRDELRETEDHLNSLRLLRQRYLDDIDNAVKTRDARALVDARKRYNEEKSQQEEAFSTNQRRSREDQDLRLQQIREEESRRAEEIMAAQAEELQNLVEAEAEKRAAIEESYQEQRARAEEAYQEESAKAQERRDEALAKEQESYEKEKEQLDQQISDRLEQIAKGLADQDEITDEEAQNILETFAKYFGVDGEIDKLMEDFANRRAAKLAIEVQYTANATSVNYNPGGGSGPNYNPYSANVTSFATGGTMIARRPTLAQFGEVPEMVQFTPLSQMSGMGNSPQRVEVDLKMSGSAPPGIRSGDRDQIAGVLLNALMEAGFDRASGGRGQ